MQRAPGKLEGFLHNWHGALSGMTRGGRNPLRWFSARAFFLAAHPLLGPRGREPYPPVMPQRGTWGFFRTTEQRGYCCAKITTAGRCTRTHMTVETPKIMTTTSHVNNDHAYTHTPHKKRRMGRARGKTG